MNKATTKAFHLVQLLNMGDKINSMTREELADKLGVSRPTIFRYLKDLQKLKELLKGKS